MPLIAKLDSFVHLDLIKEILIQMFMNSELLKLANVHQDIIVQLELQHLFPALLDNGKL